MKINGITVGTTTSPKKLGDKLGLKNKVDKTTKANVAYATDGNGKPVYIPVYKEAVSESLVRRQSSGDIIVPNIPAKSVHATSKKYVDNAVNPIAEKQTELEERVADLESLTLTYTKDSATAYEKVAPAECGKYAMIKNIGGTTEVIGKSKNILNPRSIELDVISVVYNGDGSITYTTTTPSTFGEIYMKSLGFPIGKYYYYFIENGTVKYIDLLDSEEGFIQFQCDPDFNEETEEYEPSTTRTIKLMMWQDTSVTTTEYEIAPAPADTVFEPYTEPHFRHANVEKVDTLCKNLAYKQYGIKSSGGTVNDTKLIVDNTNKHCYSLIPVVVGKKYTLSKTGSTNSKANFRYFYFDREPIIDKTISITGTYLSTQSKSTTTAPANAKYLYVRWTEDDEKYPCGDVQIELGDTATEYSPFKSEPLDTLVIPESARCKFGIDSTDYDYLRIVDGRVEKVQVCDELVFTGNENASLYAYQGMNGVYMSAVLQKDSSRAKGICTDSDKVGEHYSSNSIWVGIDGNVYSSKGIYWIDILDILGLSTADEFKTYLANRYASGNPVRIIYKLAEPIVTDVTADIIAANPKFSDPKKRMKLLIEGGSRTRFVNENEMPVPSAVWYVTRKE